VPFDVQGRTNVAGAGMRRSDELGDFFLGTQKEVTRHQAEPEVK
jgi:hypothetical protein